jgi:hypothetical protein
LGNFLIVQIEAGASITAAGTGVPGSAKGVRGIPLHLERFASAY